jgi:hypothetical protein
MGARGKTLARLRRRNSSFLMGVSQLRVGLLAGDRLGASLREACVSLPVPEDFSLSWLREARPQLLLVELDGPSAHDVDWGRLELLVGSSRAEEVPSAIWVTSRDGGDALPMKVLASFDRVFASEPAIAESLMDRIAHRPVVLPHAATSASVKNGRLAGAGIAYIGGYPERWAPRTKQFAESLLEASEAFGLTILARSEEEISGLPHRFRPLVRWSETSDEMVAGLQKNRVLVDFEPEVGLPQGIFDGLAFGMLVVAPRNYTVMRVLPRIVSYPKLPEDACERIAWCVHAGSEQDELALVGRKAVRNAHTYNHRIATLASALGLCVLPDPPGEADQ